MIRLFSLFVLLPVFCFSQFSSIVTNDDGSILYFSSTLRQKGTNQPNWGKIFRYDSTGFNLYSVIAKDEPYYGQYASNYYALIQVDISGDLHLVARTARRDCLAGGTPCAQQGPNSVTMLRRAEANDQIYVGGLRLSSNGKYGLQIASTPIYKGTLIIVDPSTGAIQAPPFSYIPLEDHLSVAQAPGRVIANDGTAAFSTNSVGVYSLWTYSPGKAAQKVFDLPRQSNVAGGPIIDTAGSSLIYLARTSSGLSLHRFSLQTSQDITLLDSIPIPLSTTFFQGNNGLDRLVFLGKDSSGLLQAFILNGANPVEALTTDRTGIQAAALSGDGQVCYLLTNQGRLLRLNPGRRTSDEIIGPTSVINGFFAAPGALVDLTGTGLAELSAVAAGDPSTMLNKFRLRIDNSYAAILAVTPTTARIQIPWDFDVSNPSMTHTAVVENGTDSGFVADIPIYASAAIPQTVAIAHSTFDSLVTNTKPALPGEVIHVFATGLGSVDPPVPLGSAAPANPLSRIVGGMTCAAIEGAGVGARIIPLAVYYAGLAPGTIGYYQIDLRLPTDYFPMLGVPYTAIIECTAGKTQAGFSFPFRPN